MEILEIKDFLSIKHIKWEIGKFNIITGDMGTGKSLCMKILQFFEDIVPSLLNLPYEGFIRNLEPEFSFEFLAKEFAEIFDFTSSVPNNRPEFNIRYTFSCKEVTFDATVSGQDETNISFSSMYLENLLKAWHKYALERKVFTSENVTPDGFEGIKQYLYNELLKKSSEHFPTSTTFVPSSRAALACASSYLDKYLQDYKSLVDLLPKYRSRNDKMLNAILKAKMKVEDGFLFLESDDGRKVPITKASSGQQEIVYVLLLLDRLGNFRYTYGKEQSVFIEEPSAHLFPLEQKQTIELIVRLYNELKVAEKPVRFFITTHSPYVLNSLNNILKKGALLEQYQKQTDKINQVVDIPHLYADEVSAYFIDNKGNGNSMLDRDEKYMFADKIAEISFEIDKVTAMLSELNNELLNEKE